MDNLSAVLIWNAWLEVSHSNEIIRSSKGGGGFSLRSLCYYNHSLNRFSPNAHLNFVWLKMVKVLSRIKVELGDTLFQFPVPIFNLELATEQ